MYDLVQVFVHRLFLLSPWYTMGVGEGGGGGGGRFVMTKSLYQKGTNISDCGVTNEVIGQTASIWSTKWMTLYQSRTVVVHELNILVVHLIVISKGSSKLW